MRCRQGKPPEENGLNLSLVVFKPVGRHVNHLGVSSRYFMYTAVLHLVYWSFGWGRWVIVGCYNWSRCIKVETTVVDTNKTYLKMK